MNALRPHRSTQLRFWATRSKSIKWFLLTAIIAFAAPIQGQVQHQSQSENLPAVRDEALRRELLSMSAEDQQARVEMMRQLKQAVVPIGSHVGATDAKYVAVMAKVTAKLSAVDGKNRQRLKEIVEQHGWPGQSIVGKDGANAAWLLVQHADADHEFQRSCLALMQALPDGEIAKQEVAYLTDRVLVAEKKPQRYGTQMDGEFKLKPLEDPENVDRRRAEVGLPPLDEYVKMSKEMYKNLSAGAEQPDNSPH